MKVFISYSMEDTDRVQVIADQIRPHVEEVNWWNESKAAGEVAWESINKWIDEADLVLAVITDKVVSRAMAIGQELGRATEKGKKIIPLVERGVSNTELGFLSTVTYIRFDHDDTEAALEPVKKAIEDEKQNRAIDKAVSSLKVPAQRQPSLQTASNEGSVLPGFLLGALIVGGLYLAFKE
jgi:hypothetical protein